MAKTSTKTKQPTAEAKAPKKLKSTSEWTKRHEDRLAREDPFRRASLDQVFAVGRRLKLITELGIFMAGVEFNKSFKELSPEQKANPAYRKICDACSAAIDRFTNIQNDLDGLLFIDPTDGGELIAMLTGADRSPC